MLQYDMICADMRDNYPVKKILMVINRHGLTTDDDEGKSVNWNQSDQSSDRSKYVSTPKIVTLR